MSFLSSELDAIIRQNIHDESAYQAIRQLIERERTPAEVQSRYLKQLHGLATTRYNNLQTMFEDYLQVGCNVLGIEHGIVSRIQGQTYEVKASHPSSTNVGVRKNLDQVICNLTVQEQKTLAYRNMNLMPNPPKPSLEDFKDLENYIGTPILVNDEIWGTICFFDNQQSDTRFAEHDIEFVELMAQGISSAIENDFSRQQREIAEGRYRLMFENIDTPVILYQVDTGLILDVNSSAVDFYGYTYEEFLELSASELNMLPPEDATDRIMENRAAGIPYMRFPHRLKSGEIREVEAYISDLEVDNQLVRFAVIYDYSERHEAEEALKRSEANLRAIFDNTSQITFLVDDTLSIVSMNRAARTLIEVISDIAPRPDDTLHHHRVNAADYLVSDYMKRALVGETISHEAVIKLSPHQRMYIDYRYVAVRTPDDKIIGVCVTGQDITNLKLSQEDLARERNVLRVLIDNLPDSIYIKDTNARILTANQQYVRGTKLDEVNDVIGKNAIELFPEYGKEYYEDDVDVLSGKEVINKHVNVVIDDEIQVIDTTKIPLRDGHGHVTGLVGVGRNITEQQLIEAALGRRDAILNTISNAAQQFLTNTEWRDGIENILEHLANVLEVDRVYIFENVYVNGVLASMPQYEWSNEGIPTYTEILSGDVEVWTLHRWVETLQSGQIVFGNLDDMKINEQKVMQERGVQSLVLVPVMIDNHWWGGMGFDVYTPRDWYPAELDALMTASRTLASAIQQEEMERGIRENEEKFTQLITHIPEAFWIYDIETEDFIYASDNYERMFGLTIEQRRADSDAFMQRIHPDDVELLKLGLEKQAKGETLEYEARFNRDGQGTYRWLNIRIYPIHDETGKSYRVAGIASDITARKRAEQNHLAMLAERERANILSQFIRDATHEFKTPLSIINTRLYLMDKTKDPEQKKYNIELIQEQVKGISSLLETLMQMARLDSRSALTFSPIDVNGIIRQMMPLLETNHPDREADFNTKLDETLPPIMGHMGFIQDAIENLVDNAVRYSFVGNPIHLETRHNQESIIIDVIDYGMGMSEEDLSQIFKRFYRKDAAHSTRGFGLGLPIVQRIAEHHGGEVQVSSKVDEGSTFSIYLPKLKVMSD